jgi:phosphomannomutase
MKKVVLFDMDGTLTEPRKKMKWEMTKSLYALQNKNYEIGIVSGSDLDYIVEQCQIMLDLNPVDWKKIHYLPCNGTKYYTVSSAGSFVCKYSLDMRATIGIRRYNEVVYQLLEYQRKLRHMLGGKEVPLTGTFIQYRGSMINWCMIGRNASVVEREKFKELDKVYKFRNTFMKELPCNPTFENLVFKLGGNTSIDIYQSGWDKTYSFKNFDGYDEVYFIGDRCTKEGNDYEAYIAAKEKGYITTGPKDTIRIIEEILLKEK